MRTVLKFGGSSVADVEKMKLIAERLGKRRAKGEDLVVVVSAMGKTTNALLSMAREASENPSKREIDMMLSTGEQVSIALLSMVLQEKGLKAVSLTGYQAGILTEGLHTKNKILDIDTKNIEKHLSDGNIVVVAGFQGYNEEGEITTLGRGGSDTTAVALAAKLGCDCEIYTDVDGIYGVDPRLYKAARHLDFITYEEMKEMAFLGAKVMEPRSVDIAQHYGVVIYVGSAHEDKRGTYIREGENNMEQRSVTGLSVLENIMMVTINNLPNESENISRIFTKLADEEINVDMISQIPMPDKSVSLSFTASAAEKGAMESVLHEIILPIEGVKMETTTDILKISVVGSGMRTQSGVAAKLFKIFADNGIAFKQVTTSEISISYTLEKIYKEKAVQLIADAFSL
ncbi:MAG TPA: aspartate kinase [Bacteroidales bacterium]|nr:aspartate kinase [Bacteroidales bacterium]